MKYIKIEDVKNNFDMKPLDFCGYRYISTSGSGYYLSNYDTNSIIFSKLKLDKKEFCNKYYKAGSGDFPECPTDNKQGFVNCVNELLRLWYIHTGQKVESEIINDYKIY